MNFLEFINEGTIQSILSEKPMFLLIIGGSGSGKNYVYNQNFSSIELVDTDKIIKKLANGDYEAARKYVSKAVAIANKMIEAKLKLGESVAQVTTGSGAKALVNKINKAKEYGFKTAVVLIDTNVNKAIKRNQERAAKGDQGLVPDWKVQKTNEAARESYNIVKDVADISLVIKN